MDTATVVYCILGVLCLHHGASSKQPDSPFSFHSASLQNVPESPGMPDLPSEIREELEGYRELIEGMIEYNTNGEGQGKAWENLAWLCDTFGARFTGTPALEDAIDALQERLETEFSDREQYNIHSEAVQVVEWTRNVEELTLVSPVQRQMAVLGSGYSPSTTGDQFTNAEVIVVRDYDELEEQAANNNVAGKIVVYNQEWNEDGYSGSSTYRFDGPSRASEHGAIAALTRSLGDLSLYTPHTGSTNFDNINDAIPCGCITVEDARMLQRMQDRGEEIRVNLNLQYTRNDNGQSRNLLVDLIGTEHPEQIVLFGGHVDSWDVGVGAMDDGGGIIISWHVLSMFQHMGFRPKRTLRLIFWTAEEVEGNPGAAEYYENHRDNIENFVMVMESDSGTFTPLGLEYTGAGLGQAITEYTLSMLEPIGATHLRRPAFGVDIRPWMEDPDHPRSAYSLYNANDNYFWYHHTEADTMDVQEPENLDGCALPWAVGALLAADYSDDTVWYTGDHPGYISAAGLPVCATAATVVLALLATVVNVRL